MFGFGEIIMLNGLKQAGDMEPAVTILCGGMPTTMGMFINGNGVLTK